MSSTKTVAKNTMALYLRMGVSLIIGLFTSRIVLEALGQNNYGIFSVVGGIIGILSFLNLSLAGATQRFLNYEMGNGTLESLKRVFKSSLQLHIIVSAIVFVLGETVGLWFLNTHMKIPPESMRAANWVYQFSVISSIVGIMTVPYNALILAHEKMGTFAYLSFGEVFLRLLVVISLLYIPGDRLIYYSAMMFVIGLINRGVYNYFCRRWFAETKIGTLRGIDHPQLKAITGFSVWTVVGCLGYLSHTQGIAIVINIFFGTLVNAAQGVTNTVNGIITGFVGNFLVAFNPQIVKEYAAGNLSTMHRLLLRGCKFSFFMMAVLAVPLLFCTPAVLNLWLKEVPNYTVIFIRITLLISLFNCYSGLLATAQGATGKIRIYQVTLTSIGLLHVPLAWWMFAEGFAPYWAMIIYLGIVIVLQIFRVQFVCRSTKLGLMPFIKGVAAPTLICFFMAVVPGCMLYELCGMPEILTAAIVEIILVSSIWTLGLHNDERTYIMKTCASLITKLQSSLKTIKQ